MLLRFKLFQDKTELMELTLKDCNYQDFRNHFVSVSFTHGQQPYTVKIYKIDDDKQETLVAEHII